MLRPTSRLLTLLSLCFGVAALASSRPPASSAVLAYQRPLEAYLQAISPLSRVQVLGEMPTRLLVTTEGDPEQLRQDLNAVLVPEQFMVVRAPAAWHPSPGLFWLGALLCAIVPLRRLAAADGRKFLARLRAQADPRGLRQACIILASFPAEFRRNCLDQLRPQHRTALNIPLGQLSSVGEAERQRVMVGFKVELAHRRRKLGRAGEMTDPDYHLVAQILEQGYLSGGPGPEPVSESRPLRARANRRKIFICPHCDHPFVVEAEFRRHTATHQSPVPRLPYLQKAGAALLLLASLSALHPWPQTARRVKFPQARPLSTREQVVVDEACRLVASDLMVFQTSTNLILLCDASERPSLQSLVDQYCQGSILIRCTATSLWDRIPWLEAMLAAALIAAGFRLRSRPKAQAASAIATDPMAETEFCQLSLDLSISQGSLTGQLEQLLESVRRQIEDELGLPLGRIGMRIDPALTPSQYVIRLGGLHSGGGLAAPSQLLAVGPPGALKALSGFDVWDPVNDGPGKWISPHLRHEALRLGCRLLEPVSLMVSHVTQEIRSQAGCLLSQPQLEERLKQFGLVVLADQLAARGLDRSGLLQVLCRLLEERVSIRNLGSILEILMVQIEVTTEPTLLTEFVRRALASQICQACQAGTQLLNVITLDPNLEQELSQADFDAQRQRLVLDRSLEAHFLRALQAAIEQARRGPLPLVLLCPPNLRYGLRRLTRGRNPQLSVLCWDEIATDFAVSSLAQVTGR